MYVCMYVWQLASTVHAEMRIVNMRIESCARTPVRSCLFVCVRVGTR